jgi:hypothetical protein
MNNKLYEKLALNEELVKIAHDGVLKFGKVSISYLMRKLKCSASKAKEIMVELGYAT